MSDMTESRSGQRRFSARIIDVSMGSRRMVASAITPVSPRAPAVPQKSSRSDSGETVIVPLGVCRVKDSTWLAKLPSKWWLFPCTSAAIAPPTVTSRVPGVTCTNQPSGTIVRMIASRLTPASTRMTPRSRSMSWNPARVVASSTVPPAFWAASP